MKPDFNRNPSPDYTERAWIDPARSSHDFMLVKRNNVPTLVMADAVALLSQAPKNEHGDLMHNLGPFLGRITDKGELTELGRKYCAQYKIEPTKLGLTRAVINAGISQQALAAQLD